MYYFNCVYYFLRGNKERAHQLYNEAIDNSRSIMELQQAYIAYEVFSTQVY